MTRQLPPRHTVRYDYHQHPTGVSAVVLSPIGTVAGVGYAKFNHQDPAFDFALGERIALGRALSRLDNPDHGAIKPPRYLIDATPTPAIRQVLDERLREALAAQR